MKLARLSLWPAAAAVLAVCQVWLTSCLGGSTCLSSGPRSGGWLPLAVQTITLMFAVSSLAWALRLAWLLLKAHFELRRLPLALMPATLVDEARALAIDRIRFLDLEAPLAFSAGVLRPTVYVSRGLQQCLASAELKAVLLHEAEHVRVREPLRRATRRSLADVCFHTPLFEWWANRQLQLSELQADRRAIAVLGQPVVARALWTLGGNRVPDGTVAAFSGGAVGVRVAQLLGDEVRMEGLRPALLVRSLAGLSFALATMWCLAQITAGLR